MSWTYQFGANPQIDYPRMLISDTNSSRQLFQDSEILAAYGIQASVFQSSMFYSPPMGATTLPTSPVSYFRVAAILLDCMAASNALIAAVIQLLDVKLAPDKAADALRAMAADYRKVDDESGAFVIIEQVNTSWAFRDRFWSQVQRQQSGALI